MKLYIASEVTLIGRPQLLFEETDTFLQIDMIFACLRLYEVH